VTSAIVRKLYRLVTKNPPLPLTLGLNNIYVLPTGHGLLYLMVLGAMLIGAVNYNNNLGFLLTFLLGGLGLSGMLHTYGMLYGLRLVSADPLPAFAGETAEVEVTLAGIDRPRIGIAWYFNPREQVLTDLTPDGETRVRVRVKTELRGLLDPGLLRIACTYPLGLFRAWARINPGLQCLVYPRPVSGSLSGIEIDASGGEGEAVPKAGVDDFQGLSAYQPGDPPQRIYWSAYSRGRGLYTKTFSGPTGGGGVILELKDIAGEDIERKLSILCFQVLRAHRRQRDIGLNLDGRTIPLGHGREHRDRCLRALALYGKH
jgi:uncharacterized protein (DUF58 family)